MKVLHLTHTSLDWDYRIQGNEGCRSARHCFPIYGVGVAFDEGDERRPRRLRYENFGLLGRRIPKLKFLKFRDKFLRS